MDRYNEIDPDQNVAFVVAPGDRYDGDDASAFEDSFTAVAI